MKISNQLQLYELNKVTHMIETLVENVNTLSTELKKLNVGDIHQKLDSLIEKIESKNEVKNDSKTPEIVFKSFTPLSCKIETIDQINEIEIDGCKNIAIDFAGRDVPVEKNITIDLLHLLYEKYDSIYCSENILDDSTYIKMKKVKKVKRLSRSFLLKLVEEKNELVQKEKILLLLDICDIFIEIDDLFDILKQTKSDVEVILVNGEQEDSEWFHDTQENLDLFIYPICINDFDSDNDLLHTRVVDFGGKGSDFNSLNDFEFMLQEKAKNGAFMLVYNSNYDKNLCIYNPRQEK